MGYYPRIKITKLLIHIITLTNSKLICQIKENKTLPKIIYIIGFQIYEFLEQAQPTCSEEKS